MNDAEKAKKAWLLRRFAVKVKLQLRFRLDGVDARCKLLVKPMRRLVPGRNRSNDETTGYSLVPGGSALCQRIFTRLDCPGPPPHFRAEFYPYSSLVLTIRRRDDHLIVRFSDLLQRAPLPVLEAAAALLISRIYRRRTPRALVAPYHAYAKSHQTRGRIQKMRRGRVKPAGLDPVGQQFDLNQMFDDLNQRFFRGTLERPNLGWSKETGSASSARSIPVPIKSCSTAEWTDRKFPSMWSNMFCTTKCCT